MSRFELKQLYINQLLKAMRENPESVKMAHIDSRQEGLCVIREKSGSLNYCYVYFDERKIRRQLQIAACDAVTLKEARAKAAELTEDLAAGIDISANIGDTATCECVMGNMQDERPTGNRPKWMKTQVFKGIDFLVSEIFERFKMKVPKSQEQLSKSDTPLPELRSALNHRLTLKMIAGNFQDFFPLRVSEVTCYLLRCWGEDAIQTRNVTVQTVNRNVNAFRGMIHWAYRVGLIPEYKLHGYENLKESARSGIGRRCLSNEEIKRLLSALDKREADKRDKRENYEKSYTRKYRLQNGLPVLDRDCPPVGEGYYDFVYPMVCLALHTGARKGSLIGLKWRDVDFGKRVIVFQGEMSKSGNAIVSPINSFLLEVLSKWKRQNEISDAPRDLEKYILYPCQDPYQPISNSAPTCWTSLLEDAEISNFRWHDLRHTFASTLANSNVPLPTLQALMGHANIKTTSLYLHATDEQKKSAVDLLKRAYA